MVQEVSGGNKWQMLGANIGQGISEQIPKEVERYRLSQGLRNIQQNPGNQIENLIRLYSTPGVSPEMSSTLAPLLQAEYVKQRQQNTRGTAPRPQEQPMQGRGQPASFQPSGQGQQPPTQIYQPNQQEQINTRNLNQQNINPQTGNLPQQVGEALTPKRGITTLGAQTSLLQPNLTPTPEQIQQRSYQLQDELGLSPDQGDTRALNEAKTQVANNEEIQKLATRENEVKKQIDTDLTKTLEGLGADLGAGFGEERMKELNNAYEDVASGKKTVLQATNEAAKRLLPIAEDITKLQKIGDKWFPGSEESVRSMKQLSKKFADRGQSKLFYNTLRSQIGLSPSYAKYLSNPYSKEYSNYLNSVKKVPVNFNAMGQAKYQKEGAEKIAKNLLDNLGKDDSILAGLLDLGRKGYDKGEIMEEIRKQNRNGFELYPSHIEELDENPSAKRQLYDIYFFSDPALDKLLEQND